MNFGSNVFSKVTSSPYEGCALNKHVVEIWRFSFSYHWLCYAVLQVWLEYNDNKECLKY